MEAEGENWEKRDSELELPSPSCCPSAFSISPLRPIIALYSKWAVDVK